MQIDVFCFTFTGPINCLFRSWLAPAIKTHPLALINLNDEKCSRFSLVIELIWPFSVHSVFVSLLILMICFGYCQISGIYSCVHLAWLFMNPFIRETLVKSDFKKCYFALQFLKQLYEGLTSNAYDGLTFLAPRYAGVRKKC